MNTDGWKVYAEMTGIVAIVASLVFGGLEMQQTQTIAQSERVSQILTDRIEWTNLVNESRGIWIRDNKGEELNEIDMSTYRDLFGIRSSLTFFQVRAAENLGGNTEIYIADFATFLHQNPGARREWERRQLEMDKYRLRLLTDETLDTIIARDNVYISQLRANIEELDRLYGE